MLEHQHPVGAGDGDRTARSALADDHRDDWNAETKAFLGRARDGFRLPPLLGLDPRERAWRIHQRDDGNTELVRETHQPDRLAIAFRLGHPEIVLEPRGGVVAFLMPDEHDPASIDPCEA